MDGTVCTYSSRQLNRSFSFRGTRRRRLFWQIRMYRTHLPFDSHYPHSVIQVMKLHIIKQRALNAAHRTCNIIYNTQVQIPKPIYIYVCNVFQVSLLLVLYCIIRVLLLLYYKFTRKLTHSKYIACMQKVQIEEMRRCHSCVLKFNVINFISRIFADETSYTAHTCLVYGLKFCEWCPSTESPTGSNSQQ